MARSAAGCTQGRGGERRGTHTGVHGSRKRSSAPKEEQWGKPAWSPARATYPNSGWIITKKVEKIVLAHSSEDLGWSQYVSSVPVQSNKCPQAGQGEVFWAT